MIKLNPDPTFECLVRLTDTSNQMVVDVPMTFRHKTAEQITAWFSDCKDKPTADGLDLLIQDWSGVMDDCGQYVPYSKAALASLLGNYKPATNEIVRAYMQALNESKVKN